MPPAPSAPARPALPAVAAEPAPPAPPPPPPPSPPPGRLSGLPTRPGSPVLAVKVDNTAGARGQDGLEAADVVYVEQVEGGLTRLLAVYNSRLPPRIGPVRSVRTDNVELLAPYGAIAFAYAGGQPAALAVVRRSPLLDDSYDAVTAAYAVDPSRRAPYSLFLDPAAALRLRAGVGAADVGMRFDVARPPRNGAGGAVTVGYPSARVSFRYDAASHSYTVSRDGVALTGTGGTPVRAANVVVQRVAVAAATGLVDVLGHPSPATSTTGSGEVTVFRDGSRVDGRWSRPASAAPTHWRTLRTGADISLRPGTTWVVLASPAAPVTAG